MLINSVKIFLSVTVDDIVDLLCLSLLAIVLDYSYSHDRGSSRT